MNAVNPYSRATSVYQPGSVSSPTSGPPALPETSPAAPTGPSRPLPEGITAAEQSMIDAYFPTVDPASLQLYAPGQGPTTLTPGALGTRLDVTG